MGLTVDRADAGDLSSLIDGCCFNQNPAAELRGEDGLWRPGLLNPEGYPLPENSGYAFFVYALAWGMNQRILDRSTYLPVVGKA